jgi:hypothetical protein
VRRLLRSQIGGPPYRCPQVSAHGRQADVRRLVQGNPARWCLRSLRSHGCRVRSSRGHIDPSRPADGEAPRPPPRRRQVQERTDHQRCPTPGAADWVHTDPWWVLASSRSLLRARMLAELTAVSPSDPPAHRVTIRSTPSQNRSAEPGAGRLRSHHRRRPGTMEAANKAAQRRAVCRSVSASSCRSNRA